MPVAGIAISDSRSFCKDSSGVFSPPDELDVADELVAVSVDVPDSDEVSVAAAAAPALIRERPANTIGGV